MLKATNTGNVDLANVVVNDSAPQGIELIKANFGTVTSSRLAATIPSLKTGASITITVIAKLTTYQAGDVVNKACVDAKEAPGSPDDCDTAVVVTPHMIDVCDTTSDRVVNIDEKDFESSRYTKDLSQCNKVSVCDTSTGKVVIVPRNNQTNSNYTTDLSRCASAPEPVVSALPHTGIGDIVSGGLGLGSLVGAGFAYINSRRSAH